MVSTEHMKAQYTAGVTRFFTPTEIHAAIPDMIKNYGNAMDDIRTYQDLINTALNSAGIPSARRASFLAFGNACYRLFISRGIAGMAAPVDALALVFYFGSMFVWKEAESACAVDILHDVFSVDIVVPPPTP